jgi:hypothetical protein
MLLMPLVQPTATLLNNEVQGAQHQFIGEGYVKDNAASVSQMPPAQPTSTLLHNEAHGA